MLGGEGVSSKGFKVVLHYALFHSCFFHFFIFPVFSIVFDFFLLSFHSIFDTNMLVFTTREKREKIKFVFYITLRVASLLRFSHIFAQTLPKRNPNV